MMIKVFTLLLASTISIDVEAFTFTTIPAHTWNKESGTKMNMNKQENELFTDHVNAMYKGVTAAAVSLAIFMNPTPALADGKFIYTNAFFSIQ